MTTEFLHKVSMREPGRHETANLSQREHEFLGQRNEENSLVMIRPVADRMRSIPVRWLISHSREIPVIWD